MKEKLELTQPSAAEENSKAIKVSICVITYKRPEGLRRLLQGLNQLKFHKVKKPDIEVVIVDNDISGIAEKVSGEIAADFQWSLKTNLESQRGIAYARNKSIACTSADSEFIAIIDDDELPETSWLDELLFVQQKYAADVVTGPVLPDFQEQNVPNWAIKGKFYEPPRYQTGEKRNVAFTGNVLVRAAILRQFDPVFDNRFAITGGEDSHLFLRIDQLGYKIVWADEASAYEWVPQSRINPQWIFMRGYTSWGHQSSIEKELYPSFKVQAIRIIKGLALIIIGLAKFIPALLQEKHARVNSLLYISRGIGTLTGLLGINYKIYKNI